MSLDGVWQIDITSRAVAHPGESPAGRILLPLYSDGSRYFAISDDGGRTWSAVNGSSVTASIARGSEVPLVAKCHKARSLRPQDRYDRKRIRGRIEAFHASFIANFRPCDFVKDQLVVEITVSRWRSPVHGGHAKSRQGNRG